MMKKLNGMESVQIRNPIADLDRYISELIQFWNYIKTLFRKMRVKSENFFYLCGSKNLKVRAVYQRQFFI